MIFQKKFVETFVRVCFVVTGVMLGCYIVFVLLPAYASGIHDMSSRKMFVSSISVPFYDSKSQPVYFRQLPLLLVAATWMAEIVLLLPASIFVVTSPFYTQTQRMAAILYGVGTLVFMTFTYPVARSLVVWWAN